MVQVTGRGGLRWPNVQRGGPRGWTGRRPERPCCPEAPHVPWRLGRHAARSCAGRGRGHSPQPPGAMLAAVLLTLALLGSAHACSGGTPCQAGIVCRITKPALLVLNQETAKVIQTAFQRASYPDITGEKTMMLLGRVYYALHNIQIGHLSMASSHVELVEARSIDISIQNASVTIRGTLSYGYTSAWGLSVNHSVDFEIDSSTDLQISTQLTSDSGRVRTSAPNCYLSFHKLLLYLQGEHKPSWIQQLFTNVISFTLRLVLKGQICKEINAISNIMADFVQTRAASILSSGDIRVDISLTGPPDITAAHLESHHKGHFIYKNVSEDLPLPTFSPSLLGDARMLYFWFSEQVLDSLARAAFQDGRLRLSLTGEEFKAVLETHGFNTNQDMFLEVTALLLGFVSVPRFYFCFRSPYSASHSSSGDQDSSA